MTVEHIGGSSYRVTIDDDGSVTSHEVTVTPEDIDRLVPGADAERLLRASFEFLLEREPKEAILRRFPLSVIERYFPDYPRVIRTLVDRQ